MKNKKALIKLLHEIRKEIPEGVDRSIFMNKLLFCLNMDRYGRESFLEGIQDIFPYYIGCYIDRFFHMFGGFDIIADFDEGYKDGSTVLRDMIASLIYYDPYDIDPYFFGWIFEESLDKGVQKEGGINYTDEHNIRKVIEPLFLNELRESKDLDKIRSMKVLDPACGSGNFLLCTYKMLRILECSISPVNKTEICLSNFHGIEMEPLACVSSSLALHSMKIQMDNVLEARDRTKSKKNPCIVCGNSLRMDWVDGIDYIIGNPPFLGSSNQSKEQKEDMELIFKGNKKKGNLDYVACWFKKGAVYLQNNPLSQVAFVSTNSVCQGVQVAILWKELIDMGVKINFAHRSFPWSNNGVKTAAVSVIIVGFALFDKKKKFIYYYDY